MLYPYIFLLFGLLSPSSTQKNVAKDFTWSQAFSFDNEQGDMSIHVMKGDSVALLITNRQSRKTRLIVDHNHERVIDETYLMFSDNVPQNLFWSYKNLICMNVQGESISLATFNSKLKKFNSFDTIFHFSQSLQSDPISKTLFTRVSFHSTYLNENIGFSDCIEEDDSFAIEVKLYSQQLDPILKYKHVIPNELQNMELEDRRMDNEGNLYMLFRLKTFNNYTDNRYKIFKLSADTITSSEIINMPRGQIVNHLFRLNSKQETVELVTSHFYENKMPFGHCKQYVSLFDLSQTDTLEICDLSRQFADLKSDFFTLTDSASIDYRFVPLRQHYSRNNNFMYEAYADTHIDDGMQKPQLINSKFILYALSEDLSLKWFKTFSDIDTSRGMKHTELLNFYVGDGFTALVKKVYSKDYSSFKQIIVVYHESGKIAELEIPKIDGKQYILSTIRAGEQDMYVFVHLGDEYRYSRLTMSDFEI